LDQIRTHLSGKQLLSTAIRVDIPDVDNVLFVGNLAADFDDADLEQIFSKYGNIYRSFVCSPRACQLASQHILTYHTLCIADPAR
jgi:RNA recognition motif-containing protein